MHPSIPAAPNPPPLPPGLLRAFSCLVCPRRTCKFCSASRTGIHQPRGYSQAFDTHAISCQINYTEDFSGKTSILANLSRTKKKLKRVVKACSRFYAFLFFSAYQARITWRNRELSGRESTFFYIILN